MTVSEVVQPSDPRKTRPTKRGAHGNLLQGSLLALAGAATLAIWSTDPFVEWAYEASVFLLAGWVVFRKDCSFGPMLFPMFVLSVWGFGQLAAGSTVYRYATWNASLRISALAATALVASAFFQRAVARERLLRWFAWFAFLLAIASVVAFYTSPGSILWMFHSPYPDVWG